MEIASRLLLTCLLNSLWEIPVAAAVAALTCWLLRKSPASHHHAVWVVALAGSVLVPLASIHRAVSPDPLQFPTSLASRQRPA
jgi:hypothetical protein